MFYDKMEKISRKDIEFHWRIRRFMGENGITKEDLNSYFNRKIKLEICPEGGEPIKCMSLFNTAMCIGISKQTLDYAYVH